MADPGGIARSTVDGLAGTHHLSRTFMSGTLKPAPRAFFAEVAFDEEVGPFLPADVRRSPSGRPARSMPTAPSHPWDVGSSSPCSQTNGGLGTGRYLVEMLESPIRGIDSVAQDDGIVQTLAPTWPPDKSG